MFCFPQKGVLGGHENEKGSPTSKPSSSSGKASIWQNAGKSTPDGHSQKKKKKKIKEELHLSTATEHHKKQEVERSDAGIQRTALNFRAVDAKGAAKLREQLSAHHTH